jgi:hypothetical protein
MLTLLLRSRGSNWRAEGEGGIIMNEEQEQ